MLIAVAVKTTSSVPFSSSSTSSTTAPCSVLSLWIVPHRLRVGPSCCFFDCLSWVSLICFVWTAYLSTADNHPVSQSTQCVFTLLLLFLWLVGLSGLWMSLGLSSKGVDLLLDTGVQWYSLFGLLLSCLGLLSLCVSWVWLSQWMVPLRG